MKFRVPNLNLGWRSEFSNLLFLIQAARKYNGFNRPTESHSQIITGNLASLFPPTFSPLICENNSHRIGLAHSKESFPWKSLPRQNWALKLKYILLPIITLGHQCYPLKSSYELLSKERLSSSYEKGRPLPWILSISTKLQETEFLSAT